MKKMIIIVGLFFIGNAVMAQNSTRIFKPFKVDLGIGFADPVGTAGNYFKAGAIIALEPNYSPIDPIAIGIRIEGAVTANLTNAYGDNTKASAHVNSSGLATLNYYFTNSTFRPFIGGGIGAYKVETLSTGSSSFSNVTNFGGMLRIGFEVSHFWMSAEYNFISASPSTTVNNSYIGIKLGVYFGGGRIK
jgi:opacity protein-like surface antigen